MTGQSMLFHPNSRKFFLCFFFLLLIFGFSPPCHPQSEGVSLHGDFLSTVITYGFNKNVNHPGNFLLGGQYNYPLSHMVEINGGFDLLWVELYGRINGENKQAEVFIPFVFGGATLNFNRWRIFGKLGISLDESVNDIGSGKGWKSSILNLDIGSLQFGIAYPLNDAFSLSASAGYYFGERIKFESNRLMFSTLNLGLSYNLFHSETVSPNVEKGVDEFKERYYTAQSENKELHKQIINLHDRINVLESKPVVTVDSVPKPIIAYIPEKSISIDSINNVYNLHLRESLSLKDFVNKKGLREEGRLILAEYNDIATSIKGMNAGIYLTCTIADSKVFKKHGSDFPRIQFRSDSTAKNRLVIDIDIKTTETKNKIKLKIK